MLLPGPPKRYLVKRNSNLVSTMERQNKTTTKSACSVDKKPDIVKATWLYTLATNKKPFTLTINITSQPTN